MHALTLYLIMRLGFISTVLFWGALLYFGYLLCLYCRVWWDSPCDGDNGWGEFWRGKRKRATVATIALVIAMALPSTKEATVMMVVPAVAQSSIWDRLLGGGSGQEVVDKARQLLRDGGQ